MQPCIKRLSTISPFSLPSLFNVECRSRQPVMPHVANLGEWRL